ncbi:MAG: hypothetical protein J3K34DRAFT_446309 [Monoraphidium minutum]|nr:MAG: hypothetical protein J3K34DRAFT_446309 [Monoraphidium minutum]
MCWKIHGAAAGGRGGRGQWYQQLWAGGRSGGRESSVECGAGVRMMSGARRRAGGRAHGAGRGGTEVTRCRPCGGSACAPLGRAPPRGPGRCSAARRGGRCAARVGERLLAAHASACTYALCSTAFVWVDGRHRRGWAAQCIRDTTEAPGARNLRCAARGLAARPGACSRGCRCPEVGTGWGLAARRHGGRCPRGGGRAWCSLPGSFGGGRPRGSPVTVLERKTTGGGAGAAARLAPRA